jgi:hypothetical protein
MSGLRFERQAPVAASDGNRVDVACFVGLVPRRAGDLPRALTAWLTERGWLASPYARPKAKELLDVPVPIVSWESFDRLFAWDARDLDGHGRLGTSYLGAAVRSFFAQGGKRCYVVRTGDPTPYHAKLADRLKALAGIIPTGGKEPVPADRTTWSGIGHLFGLPDVSFLCLPDLPDLVKATPPPPDIEVVTPGTPEVFAECSGPEIPPPQDGWARLLRAPRCDEAGYILWEEAVRNAGRLCARRRREVQLIAALPLPETGSDVEADLLGFLYGKQWLTEPDGESLGANPGISSAFVQLAYPWAITAGSGGLPEQLESPDGVLAGVLARSTLTRGTFRSAAGLPLADVFDVVPKLPRSQTDRPWTGSAPEGVALRDRVSLLGPTPAGLRLLSDVTTSADASYRPACVNRLVAVLVRAARQVGDAASFEPSGERLWAAVRQRLNDVLDSLFQAGALRGATPAEAYRVRCDRSTMSQQDLDEGRVVAEVRFEAAIPVETITVSLALSGGVVTPMLPKAAESFA